MSEIESAVDYYPAGQPKFRQLMERPNAGWRRFIWIFWALMGPGLLAAIANNDAGGVIAYTVTGAQFGIGLFVPLVLCLLPLEFTIQEMSMRLGAATGKGFSSLARQRYGAFWGYYHIGTLAFENLLTLITEFIGMTAGLIILGFPMWLSVLVCLALVVTFALLTGYWTKERVALFLGALNTVFLLAAALTHPSWSAIGHAFTTWNIPPGDQKVLTWYVIATIGNAIAPWMIFFQGSGTVDKGVTSRELRFSRIDTAIGCVLQVIVAAGIIVFGAVLFGHVKTIGQAGPADIIGALDRVAGRLPAVLFGLGLFNAGFLASITVSLSSSWSIAELFGWAKSLNDKISAAPKFYTIYIGSMVIATLAILLPGLPLNLIAVVTQVIGGILMTPLLIFLVLMTSDKGLMGEHTTRLFGRTWSWLMVALMAGLTLITIWQTLTNL
ncbi:MAG: divalent metal cation transporter [Peptococcaceae bacterium]|jgi:Mn2+/Fe2+ NRAMP family transporter|nr:divalent metal cation transporter [Peptococcaceae bacterium]